MERRKSSPKRKILLARRPCFLILMEKCEDNHSPVLIAQDRANIIRVKSLPNFSKSWKWVDSKQNPLVLK
ncbi:MAG: hypothetical protein WCO81_02975, partial [Cyanobacteriota bacterium ELA615]